MKNLCRTIGIEIDTYSIKALINERECETDCRTEVFKQNISQFSLIVQKFGNRFKYGFYWRSFRELLRLMPWINHAAFHGFFFLGGGREASDI